MDRDPGSTTRSASASRPGSVVTRTSIPGSAASASTSVRLETRGSRTTATVRSAGDAGRPDRPQAPTVQGVLAVQPDPVQPGQHPGHRDPGPPGQLVQPGGQHAEVAAELVDHEAGDELPVGLLQQRVRAVQRGEHPAPVDVADHHHGQAEPAGQPGVDVVALPQVDLRRRPGALADDHVETAGELGVGRVRRLGQMGPAGRRTPRPPGSRPAGRGRPRGRGGRTPA